MSVTHKPTSASGTATVEGLRNYSRLTQEYFMDRPIVDLWNFMNYAEHDPDNLEGMGAGAPEFSEIASSEIGGVLIASDNDAYGHLWVLPYWIDPAEQIDFRCLWSEGTGGAGGGSITIAVKYTPVETAAESTATAVGATALDSTIDDQTCLAADVATWTEWGYISADKAGVKDLVPGNDFLCLSVIGDLTTISDVNLIQLQARAYRRYI